MRRFATAAALYLTVLAVAAVAMGVSGDDVPDPAAPPAVSGLEPGDIELVAALEPFDSCEDLLAYFQREGLERVRVVGGVGDARWARGHRVA